MEKTTNKSAALKFICYSVIGILMFFVKIPFENTKKIPIDIIVGFLRENLAGVLPYFVLGICLFGTIDSFFIRKTYKKSKSDLFIAVSKAIGTIMVICSVFDFGPQILIDPSIGMYTVSLLGGPIGMTVLVGSLILPLVIDFGLANAFGVLLRPIMRPVFKIPGRTAVVAITAYFGNFSLGHIGVETMLKKGQVTQKEAVIVGTGFATSSIVTFMVFANMLGIMDYWTLYFVTATIVTFLITAITARLYPIRKKSNDYYPGSTPDPEINYNKNLLKNAYSEGVKTAANSASLYKVLLLQLKTVALMLGTMLASGMFFMASALIIQKYTPIFTWFGYIFWPFLKVVGMQNIGVAMQATGISILDAILTTSVGANALASGIDLALATRFYIASLPVCMIVFFSGFVPCVLSTEIQIKFHELVVLWFIRVVLTIIIIGLFGLVFL